MPKAYVLLSGGLDSSALLFRAAEEFANGPDSIMAVSVDYGQLHKKEINNAREVVQYFNEPIDNTVHAPITHTIKCIDQIIGKGGLSDASLEIPNVAYSELEGVSPTYVPFRNGLLLSILTSMAAADPEAQAVYYGAHAEDAENWAYPDCTPEFIGAMANSIYIGTYHRLRLHTPWMWLKKHEIVTEGERLGTPWAKTWSCYKGEKLHCGICPTCRARKEAFELANVVDPTEYLEDPDVYDTVNEPV